MKKVNVCDDTLNGFHAETDAECAEIENTPMHLAQMHYELNFQRKSTEFGGYSKR